MFSININDGSPQNPIKPRAGFFVRFRMPVRRQRFDQAFLHDIFRQMMIAKAASSKSHESLPIPYNRILDRAHPPILLSIPAAAKYFPNFCNNSRPAAFHLQKDKRDMNTTITNPQVSDHVCTMPEHGRPDAGQPCCRPSKAGSSTTPRLGFWRDFAVWRTAARNTLNCLIGCSIGSFAILIFTQLNHPH